MVYQLATILLLSGITGTDAAMQEINGKAFLTSSFGSRLDRCISQRACGW